MSIQVELRSFLTLLQILKAARLLGHHRKPYSQLPPSLPVLSLSQGLTQFQACPFSDVPSLSLSASRRLSWQALLTLLHIQTTSVCVFFHCGQEVIKRPNGLLNLFSYFLIGDVVFVQVADESTRPKVIANFTSA